ncbi:MAG TPA: response regulator [Terriglobales bacterium]|nr:response regulator [Terriglobales bacterium]
MTQEILRCGVQSLRMLFVDDEPNIRLTLPEILRLRGHTLHVASNVTEALAAIQAYKFDVLISDLNIGSPGDGFTVVSAMRRTQPDCVTLILTGYPGFETALQAIRNQVDDYLVKPTQVQRLVDTIERKLRERTPHRPLPMKRVSEILQDNQKEIIERTLEQLSEKRKGGQRWAEANLPAVLAAMADALNGRSLKAGYNEAARYGRTCRQQGCDIGEVFEEFRALERAVYEVVQENLLCVDVSNLVPDLRAFNDYVQSVLLHAINAFLEHRVAA